MPVFLGGVPKKKKGNPQQHNNMCLDVVSIVCSLSMTMVTLLSMCWETEDNESGTIGFSWQQLQQVLQCGQLRICYSWTERSIQIETFQDMDYNFFLNTQEDWTSVSAIDVH